MCLIAGGLLLHSFTKLLSVDPGFRPEGTLSLKVALPFWKYDTTRVPPVWGDDSFNSAAGMNQPPIAAAFIRMKMPYYGMPALSRQEAWDVAQLLAAKPRPQRLRGS